MTAPLPLTLLKPSCRRVLYTLRHAGATGATTSELCHPDTGGIRFGARINELRDYGCTITRVQLRPGAWRYWLIGTDPFETRMASRLEEAA